MECEVVESTVRLPTFIPDICTNTPEMVLARTAWARINRLRTGVGHFRSCFYKWSMAPSAACECEIEAWECGIEQTVDHVVRDV